jgi:hypothetical protein
VSCENEQNSEGIEMKVRIGKQIATIKASSVTDICNVLSYIRLELFQASNLPVEKSEGAGVETTPGVEVSGLKRGVEIASDFIQDVEHRIYLTPQDL